MIAEIRNAWIRRTVLVLACVVYVPFAIALRLAAALWEAWLELRQDVPAAWRGIRGR